MNADTAVSIFREVAIGDRQACALMYDGEKYTVHIRAPIWAIIEGTAMTSDKFERYVELAARYNQPHAWFSDQEVFIIGHGELR